MILSGEGHWGVGRCSSAGLLKKGLLIIRLMTRIKVSHFHTLMTFLAFLPLSMNEILLILFFHRQTPGNRTSLLLGHFGSVGRLAFVDVRRGQRADHVPRPRPVRPALLQRHLHQILPALQRHVRPLHVRPGRRKSLRSRLERHQLRSP